MLCVTSMPMRTICSVGARQTLMPCSPIKPLRMHLALTQVRASQGPEQYDVPPPPPPPPQMSYGEPNKSATPQLQDMSWKEFKERYLRPYYLQLSFIIGALTLGLRASSANYTFSNSPFEYLGTAASTGVMCMALAWVLFDFTDTPPPGGNFSSPRK